MAKKSFVLKLRVKSEELRKKATSIAAGTKGVATVEREKGQELFTVEGDDVDISRLVQTLRKKVGDTEIFAMKDIEDYTIPDMENTVNYVPPKLRIVLKVHIKDNIVLRAKAMEIAGGTYGVTLVQFEKFQNDLIVEGEYVNVAVLLQTLNKKVGDTEIFTISQIPGAERPE